MTLSIGLKQVLGVDGLLNLAMQGVNGDRPARGSFLVLIQKADKPIRPGPGISLNPSICSTVV